MKQAIFSPALTVNLLRDLRRANTETAKKERLIQYITATFANDEAAQQLISDITLGAERTISNIPRARPSVADVPIPRPRPSLSSGRRTSPRRVCTRQSSLRSTSSATGARGKPIGTS
jgi:hypothetical protein